MKFLEKKKNKNPQERKLTESTTRGRDDRNKLRDEEEAPGSTHPSSSSPLSFVHTF